MHERFEWRKTPAVKHRVYPAVMSVCIAMKRDLFGAEVVACCDRQISTDYISSETGFKVRPLNNYWIALQAGVDPITDEVLDLFGDSMPDVDDLNPIEALRVPLRQWRRRLAEAYIHQQHAISFDEFYDAKWMDTEIWSETQREIGRRYETQKKDVQLVLIGQVGMQLNLYSVIDGEISECKQIAVTGTGYAVAEAALYWRLDHDMERTLEQTVYAVYEAKKLSEMSPYVGEKSVMSILTAGQHGIGYSRVNQKALAKQFQRFGPKPYRASKH